MKTRMPPEYPGVDTPALVIEERVALRNIARFQDHCDLRGLKLRPHIKTHKSRHFAKAQIAAGATGITCQKIGEAEVMAEAGIDDILVAYNIVGEAKLMRLRALAERVRALSVVADSPTVVDGLGNAFQGAATQLAVLVECDTGGGRCGVQSPGEAAGLARVISTCPGLLFGGLLTYPAVGGQGDVVEFMRLAKSDINSLGMECAEVSSGGSPDMWRAESHGMITEFRVGTYIYNDRSLVDRSTCTWEDCAARVISTVVGVPTKTRAIIDAGTKILTSDLLGLDGFGYIVGHPRARIAVLNEEHGIIECSTEDSFEVGDTITIIPNHICSVVNMVDKASLIRKSGRLSCLRIDARGKIA